MSGVPRIPINALTKAFPGLELTFIGSGGQSDAWRGRASNRDEILRVLIKAEAGRLENEVAALTTISSPHLMQFYGMAAVEHEGREYPVVRGGYVPGGTVAEAMGRGMWPTGLEVVECTCCVLRAMRELHRRDLVHRDIKPANIALRDGRWDQAVVLDLGYVRNLVGPPITVYPTGIGTVAFMAPEQLRLEPAGLRSDMYSLGITAFWLATQGHPFFANDDGPSLGVDVVLDRMESATWPSPVLLSKVKPKLFRQLLLEMLAYEPSDRPNSTQALKRVEEGAR